MINLQSLWLIIGGIVAIVAFVLKVNSDNADLKMKASKEDVEQLRDKVIDLEGRVSRQYQTAKEDRDAEFKAIEEVADWMHFQEGYHKREMEQKK